MRIGPWQLGLSLAAGAALAFSVPGSRAAAPSGEPVAVPAPPVRSGPEVRPAASSAVAPPLFLLAPVERRSTAREAPEPKRIPRRGPRAPGPAHDPVLQSAPQGAPLALAGGLSFLGQGRDLSGFSVTSIPPDTNGAVGPGHYVQMVNTDVAVFNKANGAVMTSSGFAGSIPINQLFAPLGGNCAADNDGDPVVLYDQLADRWLLSQFAVCDPASNCATPPAKYYECVAVSKTGDPLGGYWLYSFDYPLFNDYPKLGVWPDAYYATFNLFDETQPGSPFQGPEVCAYDRAKMLAGQTPTQQCFTGGTSYGGLLPASVDGSRLPPAGAPDLILGLGALDGQLAAWSFHVDWTTPARSTFTGPTVLSTAAYTLPCGDTGATCVTQPGTTIKLDTLGDRLMFRNAYRNFGDHQAWVTNHSIDVGGNHTGVRWYELWQDPAGALRIYQQGTWAPDTAWRWMGSAAQDQAGNLAVGYSLSSGTLRPSLRAAGRLATDPPGTFSQAETSLFTGVGSQTGSGHTRWGDYSALVLDPADDCTFWFTSQYLPASGAFNWDTRILSFTLPGCPAADDFSLQLSPASRNLGANGSTTYTVTSAVTAGAAQAVALATFGLPAGVTAAFSPASITGAGTSTLTLTSGASITPGAAGFFVTGTGSSAFHAAGAQVVLGTVANDFSLSLAPASRTVNPGSTTTFTVTTGLLSGAAEAVALSATGLPIGVTAGFSPASVTAGGTSTLTLTASAGAAPATATFTVTGAAASATHAATASVTVAPVASDFSLALAPASASLLSGGTATFSVTTAVTAGAAASVALSVSGLPAGVTGSFQPATVTAGQGSTLTLTAAANAPAASQAFTVTGTAGAVVHGAGATVTIPSDFSLAVGPASATLLPGGTAAWSVTSALTSGSAEAVALSVSGLPADVTGGFQPASVTAGQGSTLALTAAADAPVATASFTVRGTSPSAIHTAGAQVVVPGDFSLAIAPATLEVLQGGSAAYTVTTAATLGTPQAIALSVNGLPPGVTGSFAPAQVTAGSSSVLTLSAAPAAPVGSATFTVTGAAASGSHLATAVVAVPDDFSVSLAPAAVAVRSGQGGAVTVSLPITSGSAQPVALAIDTPLPAGVTASFAPAQLASGGSATLTLTADAAAPGSHTALSVSGTNGARVRVAQLTLDVPDLFALSLSPASVELSGGGSAVLDLASSVTSGTARTITLSADGLPAGVTAAFAPPTLLAGAAGTLTLTAAADAPTADQTFQARGTAGGAGASASARVVVRSDFSLAAGAASGPLRPGGSVTLPIATALVSGSPLSVSLSAGGLPGGVTASFAPATVQAGQPSVLTLAGGPLLQGSGGAFSVVGTAGGASRTAQASVALADDFSVALAPAARSLKRGQSAGFAVTTAVTSGAAAALTLSAGGLPAGVSAAFSPAGIAAGATSTLTLTAATDAPPAAGAAFTASAAGSGVERGASAQVSVEADDFSIAIAPASRAIAAGGSATFAVSTATVSGNPQALAFSVSGLPSGVSAAFAPATTTSGGSAVLTLTAAAPVAGGTSAFTVLATGPSAAHGAQAEVSVGNEFHLAIAPDAATLRGGASATFTVSTAIASGAPEALALSVAGLPAGVTGAFAPPSVSTGGSATLTLTAAAAAPGGEARFTVTASAPGATHAVQAGVSVPDDFSLSLSPAAAALAPGGSASIQVSAARTSGSPLQVALSADGLPAGVTAAFAPAVVASGRASTLTLTAAPGAAAAAATAFTVTGVAGALSRTAAGRVSVAAGDFALALDTAKVVLSAGRSASFQALTAAAGAPVEIALSVGGLPPRVGAAVAPASLTAGQAATVTLTAPADLAPGAGVVTVTGAAAAGAHSASAQLVLLAPPQVSITAPAAGAVLSGAVDLAADASASPGTALASVEFLLDDAAIASSSGAPFHAGWDSTKATDGPHTLAAVATDAAGNTARSAPVAVSVLNRSAVRGGCGGCASGDGAWPAALLAALALARGRRRRRTAWARVAGFRQRLACRRHASGTAGARLG